MPRGNIKGNRNNSPIIGDAGVLASPDELSALTRNMKENFLREVGKPPVDLHNPEEVKQAIYDYLVDCETAGKRPGNMGLYRALNLTRQEVNAVLTGRLKSKVSPACIDILKKSIQLLGEYREQLGAQGKLNPVTMIFWQKNYDGLEDSTRLELAPAAGPTAQRTPEEIRRAIEADIPIDTEYKEE